MARPSIKWLGALMPGIFLIGYNIGTGSLTAMSKAGANFGTSMLWAVLVSCLITWYLINFFSRFTMVTGMTAMEAYRRHIHPVYAWVLWGGLTVIILSALMGMMGILVDVLAVWCREMHGFAINRGAAGVLVAGVVLGLIWIGNTKRFEAMLGIMVALMGLAFIGSAIRFFPGFEVTMKGFIPSLPEMATSPEMQSATQVAKGSDNNPYVILAGMVGTTVSVFAFLIRSGQAKDHGWTMADWKMQKRDALVSATMMFILSASVLITAAATLHARGLKMNHISEMVPMLRPLFGDMALFLFVAGILAAGLSSHLPNMMVIPWLTRDMQGQPRTARTVRLAYVFGLLTLVSILGAVLETRPVFLMLLSQAGISLVMPLALIGLIWLSSRKELMGEHRPRVVECVLLGAITAFSLFMSKLALQGLMTDIQKMLEKMIA